MKQLISIGAILILCSACAPYKPSANEQVRKLQDSETGSNLVVSSKTQSVSQEEAAEMLRNAGSTIPRPVN